MQGDSKSAKSILHIILSAHYPLALGSTVNYLCWWTGLSYNKLYCENTLLRFSALYKQFDVYLLGHIEWHSRTYYISTILPVRDIVYTDMTRTIIICMTINIMYCHGATTIHIV